MATRVGTSCIKSPSPNVSCDPGHTHDGVEKRTHRRNRVRKTQTGMMFVHKATETVWSRRTRGMLAGTKLRTLRGVCVYCNGDRARAENGMDALDTRL